MQRFLAPLAVAALVAIGLLVSPATSTADVVPPHPCPEGEEWQGHHSGSCVECPDGTYWRRIRDTEYGECVEGEDPDAGCSVAAVGRRAPAPAMLFLGAALLLVRRGRRR